MRGQKTILPSRLICNSSASGFPVTESAHLKFAMRRRGGFPFAIHMFSRTLQHVQSPKLNCYIDFSIHSKFPLHHPAYTVILFSEAYILLNSYRNAIWQSQMACPYSQGYLSRLASSEICAFLFNKLKCMGFRKKQGDKVLE